MANAPVKPKPKSKWKLWLGVAAILAAYALYCWPWFPPKRLPSGHFPPQFTLGRDTSFYASPLDDEGYPDYEEALNLLMAQGIDPEQNAVVVLQRALGPSPEGQAVPARFYEWLKMPPPEPKEVNFVNYRAWIKTKNYDLVNQGKEPLESTLAAQAMTTPWRVDEHPPIFEWLRVIEGRLAIAAEASKKTQFFHPLVNSQKGEPQGGLLETLVPTISMVRELSEGLTCRAMMRIDQGKFEDARQDLLTCHRLASLMTSKAGPLVQHSLGLKIERAALAANLVLLERADFSQKSLELWQKEWADRLTSLPVVESFDRFERVVPLQLTQFVNKFGLDPLAAAVKGWKIDDINAYREFSSRFYLADFNKVLSTVNQGVDRLVATGRMTNLGEKYAMFLAFERELEAAKEHSQLLLQQVRVAVLPRFAQREVLGEMMGQFFLRHMAPSLRHVQQSEDETEEADRLFAIALSLAIHRKAKGAYPAQLSELAPALSQRGLEDLFSGKSHLYRKTADGYLLYSVGPNGEDDGGSSWEDRRGGDDFKIHLPAAPKP